MVERSNWLMQYSCWFLNKTFFLVFQVFRFVCFVVSVYYSGEAEEKQWRSSEEAEEKQRRSGGEVEKKRRRSGGEAERSGGLHQV